MAVIGLRTAYDGSFGTRPCFWFGPVMLTCGPIRPGSMLKLSIMTSFLLSVTLPLSPGTVDMMDEVSPTMGQDQNASGDSIRGRTIRWTWTEGPTAGVTHEHVFRSDGTVEWRVLSGPQKGHSAVEDEYEVFEISENVYALSYLASSGYTLTVLLNFESGEMFGFASGQGQWYPGRGTFEVVE